MPTIAELNSRQIVEDALGAPIRVDLVKESKSPPLFGNLYTWDPETHSVVIAQFPSQELTDPEKFLLIPGSSIQNIQILESHIAADGILEEAPSTSSGSGKPFVETMLEKSQELCERLATLFRAKPEVPKTPGIDVKASGDKDNGTKRERTFYEDIKLMDEFVHAKRRRVIDALNKNGIKFKEEPFTIKRQGKTAMLLPLTAKQRQEQQEALEQQTGLCIPTVLCIPGWARILPPYGKENIIGNAKVVKSVTLTLTTEGVFNNDSNNKKEQFTGSA